MTFFLSPIGRWMMVGLAVLALVAFVHYRADAAGYHRAASEYQSRIDQMVADAANLRARELERQDAVNNAAKQREAAALAELDRQEAENHELQRKLASEAQQDPNAGKPVLGSSSVQRINQIR